MRTDARWTMLALAVATLAACAPPPDPEEHSHDPDEHAHADEHAASWSVTAWGELYEVFPEVDALAAGHAATAHTHVTVLDGFEPLAAGTVEIVLRGAGGDAVFRSAAPERPGVFAVELRPEVSGDYELLFRVASTAGGEEIRGGMVRVGTPEDPGGLVEAPAPPAASEVGEPLPFLKEEQWKTGFATEWVRRGELARAVEGLARVRPPAGGEAAVTAPVDAVLLPRPWPFPGQRVEQGAALFRLAPRVAAERSLPALQAEAASLAAELAAARARRQRLEELFALEATSRRELEEARTRVVSLEATSAAAVQDLEAARAAREGGGAGAMTLAAPFAGEIAAVTASPGAAVDAGAPLARLVRRSPLWLEVSVAPEDARALAGVDGVVLSFAQGPALRLEGDAVRLVAVAPEVDPATGTLAVLLEVTAAGDALVLGTVLEARLLLSDVVEGVVVPTTALIDDGGVTIVYLQLAGESFARQSVRVAVRQGELALVDGLVPGQRLVTLGGEAIRRASLMAGGASEGHIH